eukprot:3325090-Amphidinium_carterae.3
MFLRACPVWMCLPHTYNYIYFTWQVCVLCGFTANSLSIVIGSCDGDFLLKSSEPCPPASTCRQKIVLKLRDVWDVTEKRLRLECRICDGSFVCAQQSLNAAVAGVLQNNEKLTTTNMCSLCELVAVVQ